MPADHLLTAITELAAELADPRQHTERIPYWDANRNRKVRIHTTVQPGLLRQLRDAVLPATAGYHAGGTSGSRPPLALEALSRYAVVQTAVTRWCWALRVDARDTTEAGLHAIVGAVAGLDDDDAKALLAEMRQWRRWCAVLTGWDSPAFAPRVPCPVCEHIGTLRINLTARQALCIRDTCAASWDETTIGVLADYIRGVTERAA